MTAEPVPAHGQDAVAGVATAAAGDGAVPSGGVVASRSRRTLTRRACARRPRITSGAGSLPHAGEVRSGHNANSPLPLAEEVGAEKPYRMRAPASSKCSRFPTHCCPAATIRSAPPGTGSASISRCSPPTRSASTSACSTPPADARLRASRCRNTPTRSGMATCRKPDRERSTDCAPTAPTRPRRATGSIRTSCCSIPTRARCAGELHWSDALYGYRAHSGRDGHLL